MLILKRLFFIFLAINGACNLVYSQGKNDTSVDEEKRWYGGLQGGVPFAVSTFSSFGADKTHPGWSAGAFGGYRLTSALSFELQAAFSDISLTVQDCCLKRNYWYGMDGVRYNAPVFGMDGAAYGDLKSKVSMQRYGVQFNVNLLGFFPCTMYGRWSVELSPALSAIGTKADIQNYKSGQCLKKENTKWHLGAGGSLQVGCRVSDRVQIGVYSGLVYLTGSHLDGMPEYLHKCNYVWESGLRLGFAFGKNSKSRKENKPVSGSSIPIVANESAIKADSLPQAEPVATGPTSGEVIAEQMPREKTTVQVSRGEVKDSVSEVRKEAAKVVESSCPELVFPIIHFSFNSIWIEPSERENVARIARLLKEHPEANIRIEGYADSRGSDTANSRVSRARAEAVKDRLIKKYGIDSSRISVTGAGVDKNKPAEEARRAEANMKVNE